MSALQATSAGVKDMADGSLRITLEFDPRFAKEAYSLFGTRGTALAVAALNLEASQASAQQETIEASEPKGGLLSQWLAIRCGEPTFWDFINATFDITVSGRINSKLIDSREMCDEQVKMWLEISSKKELDHDKEAEKRFHAMIRLPYAKWLAGAR